MPVNSPRYSREEVIEAIEGSYGLISTIKSRLSVARATVYKYIENYDLQDQLDEQRNVIVDLAELKLFEQVKAGNLRAVMFVLNNLAKSRGYGKVPLSEVEEPVQHAIVVRYENTQSGSDQDP